MILLTLPPKKGWLFSFTFILISLIEWPLLLKHDLWLGLCFVVPKRMDIFIILIFYWQKQISSMPNAGNQQ
jgi:hypothetical protein